MTIDSTTKTTFDLAVIGAGSGGMAAARRAAEAGLKVIVLEGRSIGGTCVNRGCVPKKLLVHASRGADTIAELPSLGWQIEGRGFDWGLLRNSVRKQVNNLSGFHAARMKKLDIEIVSEHATLASATSIAAGTRTIRAARILIATGARPFVPPIPGAEHCLTSDDIFELPELPKRMGIIGGGYIAVEFASMLHRFGIEVSLFERGDRLIKPFDHEIAERLRASMVDQGIGIQLEATVQAIERIEDSLEIRGDGIEAGHRFDAILMACGRRPNTEGLSLEDLGVNITSRGAIIVDDKSRTNIDTIFAIGDATEALALTPVAVREGRRLVDLIDGQTLPLPRPRDVPTAAFTSPECAAVGMTERDATAAGLTFDVRRTQFHPLANLLSDSGSTIFMKALVECGTGKLLGFHFFGPHASEAIQLGAVALAAGLSEEQLHHTMALHPTTAEEVLGLGRRDEPLHQKAA